MIRRLSSPFGKFRGLSTVTSTRNAISCIFSMEKVDAEPQWVDRRIPNAKLWWYRSSRDRLPCKRGANCRNAKCKLLHPVCQSRNCKDRFCRYSHPSRAKSTPEDEQTKKFVVIGDDAPE